MLVVALFIIKLLKVSIAISPVDFEAGGVTIGIGGGTGIGFGTSSWR